MAEIGDHVATALDTAYNRYADWCDEHGLPVGPYSSWLKQECQGLGIRGLASYADTQKRKASLMGPHPAPSAP